MDTKYFSFVLIVLLFGCVQYEEVHQVDSGLMCGKCKFPMVSYALESGENPFSNGKGGSLAQYEEKYLKIGENEMRFLSDYHNGYSEEQNIWLTIGVKDGKGEIYNAVYSMDFEGLDFCSDFPKKKMKFLGKEYEASIHGKGIELKGEDTIILEDGQFNEKWEVILLWGENDGCDTILEKVLIYTPGYFYDVDEEERIELFGSNDLYVEFSGLEEKPSIELFYISGKQD